MHVNSIISARGRSLRQTKSSLAAALMITGSLLIALFMTSAPVFAETLVVGSVYFDSEQTLNEVINLSSQHDNEGIAQLIKNGHISDRTREEQDIVVLTSASTPDSPTEFRFLNGPTTFWTLAQNVTNVTKPGPTPTPLPTPTPESTPLSKESSTPSPQQRHQQNENGARFTDDSGKHIWHQVDGRWKWHRASNRHVTDWSEAATVPASATNPRISRSPAGTPPASTPRPTPTPLIMNSGTNLYNSDRTQPFKNNREPAGQ
jgi:hypothetical protein